MYGARRTVNRKVSGSSSNCTTASLSPSSAVRLQHHPSGSHCLLRVLDKAAWPVLPIVMGDTAFSISGSLTNAIKGPVAGSAGRDFQPNADRFTMVVDNGPSSHLVGHEQTIRVQHSMRDFKKLKEPKTIVTGRNENVLETATRAIWGYIIKPTGERVPNHISIKALHSRESTMLETENFNLQPDSKCSFSLNQRPQGIGLCLYQVFICSQGAR